MSKTPELSDYPRLHSVLRHDSLANAQFQKYVSELKGISPTQTLAAVAQANARHIEQLARADTSAKRLTDKVRDLYVSYADQTSMIHFIGKIIEEQCGSPPDSGTSAPTEAETATGPDKGSLKPIEFKTIEFTSTELSVFLTHYWDLMADEAEKKILECATTPVIPE